MRYTILGILLAITFTSPAHADMTLADIALLPPYCRGTQLIRDITKDPTPISEYISIYGQSFIHLHHYCWALDREFKAWRIEDRTLRDSQFRYALGDIQYVLDRSGPDFVLLPDILNTKARILFELHRDPEAVLTLNRTLEIKRDDIEARLQLSDYYLRIRNKPSAIKILEQGVDYTKEANILLRKLKKLGVTYTGVPGNAIPKSAPQKNIKQVVPHDADVKNITPQSGQASDNDTNRSANNPYCRFCP